MVWLGVEGPSVEGLHRTKAVFPQESRNSARRSVFGPKVQLFLGFQPASLPCRVWTCQASMVWTSPKNKSLSYQAPLLWVLILWRNLTHTQSKEKDPFTSHDHQWKIRTTDTTEDKCTGLKKSTLGRFARIRESIESFPKGKTLELWCKG